MKTATVAIILSLLLSYEEPQLARRCALNRELIECLKSTQCRDTPCVMPAGTGDDRVNYFAGLGALKAGHPNEAILFLRGYGHGKSRDDLSSYYLGLAYRSAGDEAAALAVWRTGGSARLFEAIGWREGSAEALRTAIAVGDTKASTFYKLGDLLWYAGQSREAVVRYQQGIALDQSDEPVRLLAAARIAEGNGDWLKAVRINEAFIAQMPDDSRGYLHAAAIFRQKSLAAPAIGLYEQCATRTKAMACYLGAGEICLANGDIAGAQHWSIEARRLFPGKSEPIVLLGAASLAAGRLKEAAQAYADAASVDPQNFWIPVYQGDLATRQGDLDGALRYYNQALRLNPSSPLVYLSLGLGYQHRGDLDVARASYKKALALAPGLMAAEKGLKETKAPAEIGVASSGSNKHVR